MAGIWQRVSCGAGVGKVKGIPGIAEIPACDFTEGLPSTSQIPMHISLSISPLYKVAFIPGLHLKPATLFFLTSWEKS